MAESGWVTLVRTRCVNRCLAAKASLVVLESIFLAAFIWIIARDLPHRGGFETRVVVPVCGASQIALLVMSVMLRNTCRGYAVVAWIILATAVVVGILYPRL